MTTTDDEATRSAGATCSAGADGAEYGDGDVDGAGGRVVGGTGWPDGGWYPYRVRGRERSGTVLWIAGRDDDPDQVFAPADADPRRVPVFVTGRQVRMYVRRHGRRLDDSRTATLELVRVQHWLDDPARRKVPAGAVLEAWNFFEDLARGLASAHLLPDQGAVHNGAYDKLFGDECDAWTPEERGAVLELLAAGVELWNTCPVAAGPR
ncbi:hypothetical protein ACFC00_38175 [Streptomyces adustus]|uniref:hypothetical protein n=1 Tax=Streptomyces adustus TaxID=1609272 RepID=UPI0035D7BFAB